MPKFFLAIVESETAYAEGGDAVFGEVLQAHSDFSAAVTEAGCQILGGEALQPSPTATYLRGTRGPDVATVDNPLPEVKEVFGGYYLLEAPDQDTALALARQCPAPFGYVEVRPIWEF